MAPTRTPYAPPPDAPVSLHHEDAHLVIVEKPAGLLCVPGRGPEKADCLEARLRRTHPGALTVHRLDMETSGLVVFALSAEAQAALSKLFEARMVEKAYIAEVLGALPPYGVMDDPIAPDWPNRPKQKVSADGKPALTVFECIELKPASSIVRLFPKTGRTHQLRVHLEALGHPILGDSLYGTPESRAGADRLHLHAERLRFEHPVTNETIDVASPCPFWNCRDS